MIKVSYKNHPTWAKFIVASSFCRKKMSADETKAPLTDPPLYPAYNSSYQPAVSYQVLQADISRQGVVQVPEEALQEKSEKKEEKEEKKKKNVELDDGDDLIPGTNPGGIPDKHFNVSFLHF